MIVDAVGSPDVVARTYNKPYGEEAFSYNSYGTGNQQKLTTIGYTGQRVDKESGLMYYNARYYDPKLSFFISADTIGVDKGDPKTRNRYSYVLNNPLKYTDPSGHCVGDKTADDTRDCEKAGDHLRRFGFRVNTNHWTLQELTWIIEAINDLLAYMMENDFSYQAFKDAMNIGDELVDLVNIDRDFTTLNGEQRALCHLGGGACADPDGGGRHIGLSFTSLAWYHVRNGQGSFRDYFKWTFVHELAHTMDYRHERKYSRGLDAAESCNYRCKPEGSVSERGDDDPTEDWAETVAAVVYPELRVSSRNGSWRSAPKHRAYARRALGGWSGPAPAPFPGPPISPSPPCWNISGCR